MGYSRRKLAAEAEKKLKNDLKELDSLGSELGRTSAERTKAEMAYEYLQDFLKTDYDKIREQEILRIHNAI